MDRQTSEGVGQGREGDRMNCRSVPYSAGRMTPARLWAAGEHLAPEHGRQRQPPKGPEDVDIVWALTREAAASFARQPRPGPSGYPSQSSMPEPLKAYWSQFVMDIAAEQTGDAHRVHRRIFPLDAGSPDRAMMMLDYWNRVPFSGRAYKVATVRAMWTWAVGVKLADVADWCGISRELLTRRRLMAANEIADEIRGSQSAQFSAWSTA